MVLAAAVACLQPLCVQKLKPPSYQGSCLSSIQDERKVSIPVRWLVARKAPLFLLTVTACGWAYSWEDSCLCLRNSREKLLLGFPRLSSTSGKQEIILSFKWTYKMTLLLHSVANGLLRTIREAGWSMGQQSDGPLKVLSSATATEFPLSVHITTLARVVLHSYIRSKLGGCKVIWWLWPGHISVLLGYSHGTGPCIQD